MSVYMTPLVHLVISRYKNSMPIPVEEIKEGMARTERLIPVIGGIHQLTTELGIPMSMTYERVNGVPLSMTVAVEYQPEEKKLVFHQSLGEDAPKYVWRYLTYMGVALGLYQEGDENIQYNALHALAPNRDQARKWLKKKAYGLPPCEE